MTRLQQVHFKLRELGEDGNEIPMEAILQEYEASPELASYIELLIQLEFIELTSRHGGRIKLTMNGLLTNVPDTE